LSKRGTGKTATVAQAKTGKSSTGVRQKKGAGGGFRDGIILETSYSSPNRKKSQTQPLGSVSGGGKCFVSGEKKKVNKGRAVGRGGGALKVQGPKREQSEGLGGGGVSRVCGQLKSKKR